MTELHVIPDERTTWRVYEAGATAALSEHTSATDAELAALARIAPPNASWSMTATTAPTTPPRPKPSCAHARNARARQLALVRERARQLAHSPHTP